MGEIQLFENEQFGNLRVVRDENGEPWFVAKDIAKALGYRDADKVTRRLDADEKGTRLVGTLGGNQKMAVINESGLYNAILGSKIESAKAFKRWVTHEVLPSIRRDGGYIMASDDDTDEEILARALLVAQKTLERKDQRIRQLSEDNARQQSQIEAMQPKALFADAVVTSGSSILVGDMAKILKQNGVNVGQNRLFEWLRRDGYLISGNRSDWNMPTQKSMDLGLFEVKVRTINNPDGSVRETRTPKVTGKGQVYLVNKYCKKAS